jgi:hypothetical protein
MKLSKRVWTGIPALALVFALMVTGCPSDGDGGGTPTGPVSSGSLTITPTSTQLEVVWNKIGDLAAPGDYQMWYKIGDTTDPTGANQVPAANILEPITGTFKVTINGLTNNTTYTVWLFRATDTYTTAEPLARATGTPVPPSVVTLAPKSHGIAASNSITGLTADSKYVVLENNQWFAVNNAGDLGNGGNLNTALSSTVSGATQIGNLSNSKTYNVFLVKPFPDADGILNSTHTGSKNTVADIQLLSAGRKLTISGSGGTVLVFTNAPNSVDIGQKTIALGDSIGSFGKSYQVTEATNVNSVTIEATAGQSHAELNLASATAGTSIAFTAQ